jgi:alkylhydroperoxidase family enzyme
VPTHIRLGRDVGLTDEQIAHLRDDPLPDGVYTPAEAAIVRFAQTSSRMAPISDELFAELSEHFDTKQLIELCFTVGNSGLVNRFHALFHTPVDADTIANLGHSPLPLPDVDDHP